MTLAISRAKSFWRDRSVLVTGGAGFIGSWLGTDLLSLGARVVVLDIKKGLPHLGEEQSTLFKKCVFVRGDVRDGVLLRTLFKKHSFQTVFHLAARALVEDVLEYPEESLDTNIRGSWSVLEAFRKWGHPNGHIIIASSDKAYGVHEKLPYREEFGLNGSGHPYDCSKGCADSIARMYAHVYRVPVCVLRCGNVYGGGDTNFSRLIPDTISSLLHDKGVRIRSDGKHKRDFLYIKDAVEAYKCAAETMHIQSDIGGEAFNFGNNKPIAVLDAVRLIMKLMKKEHLSPIILSIDRHEIKDQYLDASKAKKILKWKPRYTFAQGIAETIVWYKNSLGAASAVQ